MADATLYSVSAFECVGVHTDSSLPGLVTVEFKAKSDGAVVTFLQHKDAEPPEVGGVYLLNALAVRPQKGE